MPTVFYLAGHAVGRSWLLIKRAVFAIPGLYPALEFIARPIARMFDEYDRRQDALDAALIADVTARLPEGHEMSTEATAKRTADRLREAAERIRQHGWRRGVLIDDAGCTCAAGALLYSRPSGAKEDSASDLITDVAVQELGNWIRETIEDYRGSGLNGFDVVTDWNDRHVADKDEVIEGMTRAAEWVEEKAP